MRSTSKTLAAAILFLALAAIPALGQTTTNSASLTPGVALNSTTTISSGSAVRRDVRLPAGFASIDFTSGTGANQVNVIWADTRTYSGSATTLDLTTLAGASTNTGAASFANVKILAIFNNDAANNLIVGNAAATPFPGPLSAGTTTITIPPSCGVLFYNRNADGWACGTNKNLKIDPGANSVNATIAVAGE